jgi:hypothetical protein
LSTAWLKLSDIDWSVIKPGCTITIDGGANGLVYTSALSVQKDGSASAPITITNSASPGNDGQVVISGTGSGATTGIDIGNHKYIRILGSTWKSIRVTGFSGAGIKLGSNSQNAVLKNLEVDNNGISSGGNGITANGNGHLLYQLVAHDNYLNIAISTSSVATNTIANSWITNSISSTSYRTDGIHVVGGGDNPKGSSALLVLNSVLGPGLLTGMSVQSTGPATIRMTDCLFNNAGIANIARPNLTQPSPLNLFRVTSFMTQHNTAGQAHCGLKLTATPYDSVQNSIFMGGAIQVTASKSLGSSNVQFNTSGNTVVLSNNFVDPKFAANLANVPDNAPVNALARLDFSLSSISPQRPYGLGSQVTSAQNLLSTGQ